MGSDQPTENATPAAVEQGLNFLLTRIGSWTNARWDQHLRERMGDEHAETVIRWLAERGIRPHIPERAWRPSLAGVDQTTRVCPPAWAELEANVNGRTVFGQRGVRDPSAPCEAFDPVDGIDWLGMRLTAPGDGACRTDGHYLCLGCREIGREAIEWRTDAA